MHRFFRPIFLSFIFFLVTTEKLFSLHTLFETRDKKVEQKNSFLEHLNKQINGLKKELEERRQQQTNKDRLTATTQEIATLKEKVKELPSAEKTRVTKRLHFLTAIIYPLLLDYEKVLEHLEATLEANIQAHQEYRDDPEYKAIRLPKKSYYLFEDLQMIDTAMIIAQDKLAAYEEKKKAIELDGVHCKKNLATVTQEYGAKKKEQEEFLVRMGRIAAQDSTALAHARREAELIDSQEFHLGLKKSFFELKLKDAEQRLAFFDFQIFLLGHKIEILKDEYAVLKKYLRIDDQYLAQQQSQLDRKRAAALNLKNHYYNQISVYQELKADGQKQLLITLDQLGLSQSDAAGLDDWKKSFKTVQQWVAGAKIGNILIAQTELDVHKEYIEAQIELEKSKLLEEEIEVDTIRSWNKMTMHKFSLDTDEEVAAEKTHYALQKDEIEANLIGLSDKKIALATLTTGLNRALINLKNKITDLESEQERLFKNNQAEFSQVQGLLRNAQEHLTSEISLLAKIVELLNQSEKKLKIMHKKIGSVVVQLEEKSWWVKVSEVRWTQITLFIPKMAHFFQEYAVLALSFFHYYIHPLEAGKVFLTAFKASYRSVAIVLGQLLLSIIALAFFLGVALVPLKAVLLARVNRSPILYKYSLLALIVLEYLEKAGWSLGIWTALFTIVYAGHVSADSWVLLFMGATFYLISLPFLWYQAYSFITFFGIKNGEYGSVIIGAEYQERFIRSCMLLSCGTIFLQCIRNAFMLLENNSEVPTLLLALNFIVLQLAIISLITKKQIIRALPSDTPLLLWIKETVAKFFYPLFALILGLIILSNPYLGYGRLVLPVLLRSLFSLGLIPLFSWLYARVRKVSIDLFFTAHDEVMRERFSYSKTWHGFFVIASLGLFLVCSLFVVAKIWNYPLGLAKYLYLLRYEISIVDYDAITGKPIALTILSLAKMVLFVIAGYFVASFINRFILQRIFDPGLVGHGLQNTLLTLNRYIIVISFFLIALNNVGLSSLIMRFFLILITLGFALKEPLSDFFCYFILLVQRPIKIGDLVMLNEEIMGVVRHITPRSVVIRKRNSTTLLVPNSHFITNSITNWSYTKTFLAFNDIVLTVSYNADPLFVKDLIVKTLEANGNILKNPPPFVILSDFAENGFQFTLRGYLSADKVLEQFAIASDVRLELAKALKANNIDIARPTRFIKTVD
jgi:small-conductance mechanosensitive channel